jgi:tetratricopeptide (TPR) repeat protein
MIITTQSEKARSLFEQGLAKYDRVRPREAAPLFQQAVEADPKFALAHLFHGLAGDSVPHMRKAAELVEGASEPERLFILGWKAQLDSQLLKAVEHMEGAVKLLPGNARLRVRLAQLYNATNRPAEGGANKVRRIAPYGTLGPVAVIAQTDVSRSSGFPRMARLGDTVHFAWTQFGKRSVVRTATADVSAFR